MVTAIVASSINRFQQYVSTSRDNMKHLSNWAQSKTTYHVQRGIVDNLRVVYTLNCFVDNIGKAIIKNAS